MPGSRHGPGRAAVSPLDNGAPSPSYNHTTGGRIFWLDCVWKYCNDSNPRKAGSKCYQTILETCRGIWAIALHEVCIFCGEEVARRGLRVCWHAGWTLQKLPKLPILRHCYTCQKRQLWETATTAKTANSKKFLQLPKLPPQKLITRRDCYNCKNYQLWDTATTTNSETPLQLQILPTLRDGFTHNSETLPQLQNLPTINVFYNYQKSKTCQSSATDKCFTLFEMCKSGQLFGTVEIQQARSFAIIPQLLTLHRQQTWIQSTRGTFCHLTVWPVQSGGSERKCQVVCWIIGGRA